MPKAQHAQSKNLLWLNQALGNGEIVQKPNNTGRQKVPLNIGDLIEESSFISGHLFYLECQEKNTSPDLLPKSLNDTRYTAG